MKHALLSKLQQFIAQKALFQPAGRILVAVSGGADSVALLHLLNGFDLAVAHVNFQLRGEASNEDEAFVAQLAERLQIPFHCKRFDTEKLASETGESIQMLARRLRYAWFEELLQQGAGQWLATAHHANDAVETALFNFAKGTGLAGLCGISPTQGTLVRPLLFASKRDINAYLLENQLVWREDASNASDKYMRNHIRHHVVPALEKVNPSLPHTSADTFDRLRQAWAIVQEAASEWQQHFIQPKENGFLLLEKGLASKQAALLLHEWLKTFGFGYEQSQTIAEGRFEAGKVFHAGKHSLWRVPEGWFLSEAHILDNQVITIEKNTKKGNGLGFSWEISLQEKNSNALIHHANIAMLDASTLRFPLQFRYWQSGDSLRPLGMKGRKNVSDLLNSLKVPVFQKAQVPVLLDAQGEIAWVVGYRIADNFKITEHTELVWQMTVF